jgi:hypothetical protein
VLYHYIFGRLVGKIFCKYNYPCRKNSVKRREMEGRERQTEREREREGKWCVEEDIQCECGW